MKIDKKLFHYFEKAGTKTKYHPHDYIYMQDDSAQNLYLITKGRARVFIVLSNGDEITLEIIERGRLIGESSYFQNTLCPTTVEALTDVEVIYCNINQLYTYLTQSKELTISLLQHLTQTCDYLTLQLIRAYKYNRYEKVASFLLEQTVKDNPEKGIINNTLLYTHEEIALLIGLSRVRVTEVLNKFKKKGYITLSQKKIQVINKEGLQSVIEDKQL